jgi:hypothetical protein
MPYKDPEKQREADRRWREANPEKQREATRRWHEATEKGREQIRRWREANSEKAAPGRRPTEPPIVRPGAPTWPTTGSLKRRLDACTPGGPPSSRSPKPAPTMNGRRGTEYGEG